MSDHTIIDTSTMTRKNTFSFRNLSNAQKGAFIGGGVALTAILGSVITGMIGGDSILSAESSDTPAEIEVLESQDLETITEGYPSDDAFSNQTDALTEESIDAGIEIVEESYDLTFETEVNFSRSVNNDMTFEDAFAAARTDVGYGGWFNWDGQSYSTFTKDEWGSLSESEQSSYVDQVIEQSDIDDATWTETPRQNVDVVEEIEEEYVISDEEIELGTEDIIEIETPKMNAEIDKTANMNSVEEDLVEDIIIVKPIRGADMNDDGIVDAIVFDNDGDGNIDLVALDEDYDGKFESYMINEDGDEDLDVFVIDEGGDGIDDSDTMEEISDIVNMEDFVVLDEEDIPEDLSFIDDIFGDDETQEETIDEDLGFDDAGL